MAKGQTKRIQQIHWQGDLTIQETGACLDQLRAALDQGDKVVLHFERIGEIDIAFMQLLCSAYRTAATLGKAIEVSEPLPAAQLESIRLAGFSRHTGCSRECHGNCIWLGLSPS